MKRRRGSSWSSVLVDIVLVVILILLITLVFFSGTIVPLAKSLTACEPRNTCFYGNTCDSDEGYTPAWWGDSWCEKQDRGSICCSYDGGSTQGGGLQNEVRVYGEDFSRPLRNDETVLMSLDSEGAKAKLELNFNRNAAQYKCYGQIKAPGGSSEMVHIDTLFSINPLSINSGSNFRSPLMPIDRETPVQDSWLCDEPPDSEEIVIDSKDLLPFFGKTFEYSVVMVDLDDCVGTEKKIRQCPPAYTHTIRLKVPDRNPSIALELDGRPVSESELNKLQPGITTFEAIIKQPYPSCDTRVTLGFPVPEGTNKIASIGTFHSKVGLDNCFDLQEKRFPVKIDIPQWISRGITFDLTINTTGKYEQRLNEKDEKFTLLSEKTYRFQVAEHAELQVVGPTTGLAREKSIEVRCNGIACDSDLDVVLINDPFNCGSESFSQFTSDTKLKTTTVEGSNRFRFILKKEADNQKYVCVKEKKGSEDIYALGLWRGVPSHVTIDNSSPELDVGFNHLEGILSFSCLDRKGTTGSNAPGYNPENYISGCGERPFSYSYISDPLRFVTHVVPFGSLFGLGDKFGGCPDPDDNSQWIRWNGAVNEMDYMGTDIRVICMRATDQAGNHDVKSKLLFSSVQTVSILLGQFGQEVVR